MRYTSTRSPETQTPSNCLLSGRANIERDQGVTGLRRTEAIDAEDIKEGDWGVPLEGGGARSTLMMSWIEASRASTRDDIWSTGWGWENGHWSVQGVWKEQRGEIRTSFEHLRSDIVEFAFELFKQRLDLLKIGHQGVSAVQPTRSNRLKESKTYESG